jgi:predicted RNA-binding Zn-ribbon protein involved in translation (DUF1610 family)
MNTVHHVGIEDDDSDGDRTSKNDAFLDAVIRLESVAPGIVFGTVDVPCRVCGETTSHNCNADGSNTYVCPHCGVRNEL